MLHETNFIELQLDLWGCPPAFIEGVAQGVSERGADSVETFICPAYAGIRCQVEDVDYDALYQYLNRITNLAKKWTKELTDGT